MFLSPYFVFVCVFVFVCEIDMLTLKHAVVVLCGRCIVGLRVQSSRSPELGALGMSLV